MALLVAIVSAGCGLIGGFEVAIAFSIFVGVLWVLLFLVFWASSAPGTSGALGGVIFTTVIAFAILAPVWTGAWLGAHLVLK